MELPLIGELTLRKCLIGTLVVVPTAMALFLLTRAKQIAKHALTIEATVGGTTEPSPGFYTYTDPTSISVKATAFDGYKFKGWWLNGDFAGSEETLTFVVDEQNLLVASFELIDGPILIPAYIKPIQDCVSEDWWRVREEYHGYDSPLWIEHDFYKNGFIKFKICDAAGNGVPDQLIAVHSDPQPDITDFGWVYVQDRIAELANPVILISDSAGVVAVKIKYLWYEPDSDYGETIGMGGKANATCLPIPGDHWHYPLHSGERAGFTCIWREFTRVRPHPLYRTLNALQAYWVDNPGLPVWGKAYADCMIKIEPSKNY